MVLSEFWWLVSSTLWRKIDENTVEGYNGVDDDDEVGPAILVIKVDMPDRQRR